MRTFERLIYTNTQGVSVSFYPGALYHANIQKDVTGLSDLTDTVYSTSSIGQHGDTLTGVRIEPREISIKGKIQASEKASYLSLRRALVGVLNPELAGTLHYEYGDYKRKIMAVTDGAPKFTHANIYEEFEVDFKCPSPFWEEEQNTSKEIASWIGGWTFPCKIDITNGMCFGEREESVISDIYNPGHVSTGMKIQFRALGRLSTPQLLNINTREFIKVNQTMEAEDLITVNTSYGSKTATLLRCGASTNIFRSVDVDSTYMQLEVGDNVFRYDAAEGLDNLVCTVIFSPMYLSI